MNGPKVGIKSCLPRRQRRGNTFGHMLENLMYLVVPQTCGDNPSSAENQQERLIQLSIRILRDHAPNIPNSGMKLWSQLHGDMQER